MRWNIQSPLKTAASLSDWGTMKESMRLPLYASIGCYPPSSLFQETRLPVDIVAGHYHREIPPEVSVLSLVGYRIGGRGIVRKNDEQVFFDREYLPEYFQGIDILSGQSEHAEYIFGSLLLSDPNKIVIDEPCFNICHYHMIYGHFLLEMFPKLHLVLLLRSLGFDFPVVLHHGAPSWVSEFLELYFKTDRIIRYHPDRDVVVSPSVIVPSMMNLDYHLHPMLNKATEEFKTLIGIRENLQICNRSDRLPRRIYLSRKKLEQPSWRVMSNENEVEIVMRELGFDVIYPESISVSDQMHFFNYANCIAGEYSSALHNTLFSAPGTKVLAINCINTIQSQICSLRRQPFAIQLPADGKARYVPSERGSFAIDCTSLKLLCEEFFG